MSSSRIVKYCAQYCLGGVIVQEVYFKGSLVDVTLPSIKWLGKEQLIPLFTAHIDAWELEQLRPRNWTMTQIALSL